MTTTHNYIFSKNISINEELLISLCSWAHNVDDGQITSKNLFNYLFKTDAGETTKSRLITTHLLLIYFNKNEYWSFDDGKLRIKGASFLAEDKFMQENFNVNNKLNDNEIFSKIETKLNSINSYFQTFRVETNSISDFIKNKNNFLQILSKPITRYILKHTSTEDNYFSKLFFTNLFGKLEEYENAEMYQKLELGETIISILDNKFSNNYRISFINEELIFLLKKILNILNNVRNKKNDYISTDLEIRFDDRFYSFEKGNKVEIGFNILNVGNSTAKDVNLKIETDEEFELINPQSYLFDIPPNESKRVFYIGTCNKDYNKLPFLIYYSWSNNNQQKIEKDMLHDFAGQRTDVDWQKLKTIKPYKQEVIKNEEFLFGRKTELGYIYNSIFNLEKCFINGQKRIGKTSFARVIENKLKSDNIAVCYTEMGHYNITDPIQFINKFVENIIKTFNLFLNKSFNSNDYKFNGSLDILVDYFTEFAEDKPENKFVVIFDEFDNLPHSFLKDRNLSDNFFLQIRAISALDNISFVFIGGENIDLVRKLPFFGHLNTFETYKLDYIGREYISDYYKIITDQPGVEDVNFEPQALDMIYNLTSGNPFFTKFLCQSIWKMIIINKNLHVGVDEVAIALNDALKNSDLNRWEHFWTDRIPIEEEDEQLVIKRDRRNFLRYFANLKRGIKTKYHEDHKTKKDFVDRGILHDNDGTLSITPKIFEEWLTHYGFNELNTNYHEDIELEEYEKRENKHYVDETEIRDVIKDKDIIGYSNNHIDINSVNTWLNNFQNNTEKRVFFNLLKNVTYYGEATVRQKLQTIYTEGIRGVPWKIESTGEKIKSSKKYDSNISRSHDLWKEEKKASRTRQDILISSIDEPHKSGTYLLRSFKSANKIVNKIVSYEELTKDKLEDYNIIFFIDDIIASGDQITNNIENKIISNKDLEEFMKDDNKRIVIASIIANEEVIENLNEKYEDYNIEISSVDTFNVNNNYFEIIKDNESGITNEINIIKKYCGNIEKKIPDGYGGYALLVVFCHNCPNNSLPVLWKETKDFIPLFKRE